MYGKIRVIMKRGGIIGSSVRAVTFMFLMLAAPTVGASDSSISQGYNTTGDVQMGSIVSLSDDARSVKKASVSTPDTMVGVVTQDAVLEVSDGTDREVQVATTGRILALVSTINGDVKAGDKVTISPINGVGMKTVVNGYILGTARADFSAAQNISSQTVTAKNGEKQTVKVGLLPVQADIIFYDFSANKSILPQFLLDLANAIAGKEVSILRISIALVILVIGTVAIGLILFTAVRSSIISIGRNPLAAGAVHRGLFQVLLITFGILLAMLGMVYVVLVI